MSASLKRGSRIGSRGGNKKKLASVWWPEKYHHLIKVLAASQATVWFHNMSAADTDNLDNDLQHVTQQMADSNM